MADVDEDVIPSSRGGSEESDLTDETQDFRFLSSISREDASIPKRGEKDFEPHSTALQSNTMAASRQAMHSALAFQRTHQPRGHTTATYHPETNMAYAYNPKGVLFSKIGFVMSKNEDPLGDDGRRGGRLWLLPEEVLYLLERGSLEVRWPTLDEEEKEGMGLPMSLQGAYAVFIGDEESHEGALTFERFTVYSGLKRMGYIVHRAPSWDAPGMPADSQSYTPKRTWTLGLSKLLRDYLWSSADQDNVQRYEDGPLIQTGYYRSYAEIHRRLALINYHDPTSRLSVPKPETADADLSFRITYHVWKPSNQTYKKSAPGEPDFRISVINARETAVPTLEQLSNLMDTVPHDPPLESAPMYQKIKHGYKNVVLAVVDQGVVSYIRVMDAGFGCEKLYERRGRPRGGKRGGRGGRGRGR